MQKEFVNKIHEEKAKNDSNSRDLARTLNVLSKTVFGDVNRFIFELLQNADDSSADGSGINVKFQLLEDYLVFSHDGKHFSYEDVQGISGIGNRASNKDKNAEKTGYKGIGFKSVFGSSDYAHIVSGGFSFRFDKNFEGYHDPEEYPWQVVPIWTDEPVDQVNGYYDTSRVNTIIRVSNRMNIKEEIINVFQDCQIILFLRKVKAITFYDRDKKEFQITKNYSGEVLNLFNNEQMESSWISKTIDLPISDELSAKLNLLSDTECPQKLKEAKVSKLTFAAQVKDGHIIPTKRAVIYSYLPTKAQKGFPFLINGDFLTNAERTELMPNIWNEFLFKEIAKRQLEWFRDLQITQYRFDVLHLLNGKYPDFTAIRIETEYNISLEVAASTVDFLPEQKNEEYTIVITNSIIDVTRFSEYFAPTLITDYLNATDTHGVIDLRLENQAILMGLGVKRFDFPQLLELVESNAIADIQGAINLIRFFYNNTINGKNPTWLQRLGSAVFIMDETGQYKSPKEIFIPAQTEVQHVGFENLNYVHPDILARYGTLKDVMKWLEALGVREPTGLEIVRKAIIPMICDDRIDEDNGVIITRFIFKVYQAKLLSDQDYQSLKLLKVLTANGLKRPQQCYLSDQYNPEKKLSAVLPNANFLVIDYIEHNEESSDWKAFFKKIGVRENISIDVIEEKIERRNFERLYTESTTYLNWLDKTTAYPSIYLPYRNSGQHYIQNYTAIEFRDNLLDAEFSRFFWLKMLDSWDTFIHKCSLTSYFHRGGYDMVPSYIEYYIQNFECIPCTDKRCYRSTDVFSPSLKSIIGDHLPVADFPVAMTVAQIEFFKFKRSISPSECLKLLMVIGNQSLDSDTNKQLFAIYDQLISIPTDVVCSLRQEISLWKATGQLLAVNNTFQSATDLYLFAVQNTPAPVGSDKFLKVPTRSKDEMKALAEFFDIPMITDDLLEFVPSNITEENGIQQALLKRAPYIALIYSKKSTENFLKVLSRINTLFQTTKFINAETLSLIYKDGDELIVDSKIESWAGKSGEFYFTGNWDSPVTLYSLSNSLCNLLNLEGMEREFALIMQLLPKTGYTWLLEQGYPVNDLPEGNDIFTIHTDESPIDIADSGNHFIGVDIEFEEVFVPEITVDEINFSDVKAVVNNLSQVVINTSKVYAPIENSQVKVDIGRWAEGFVHKYLLENPESFTNVIWHNQTEESFLPYDFTVIENGINKCIEVKGTPSITKGMIKLSSAEWQQMFNSGADYTIFRVYGAGTVNGRLERNDNIREQIEFGKLLNFPMEVFLP